MINQEHKLKCWVNQLIMTTDTNVYLGTRYSNNQLKQIGSLGISAARHECTTYYCTNWIQSDMSAVR